MRAVVAGEVIGRTSARTTQTSYVNSTPDASATFPARDGDRQAKNRSPTNNYRKLRAGGQCHVIVFIAGSCSRRTCAQLIGRILGLRPHTTRGQNAQEAAASPLRSV